METKTCPKCHEPKDIEEFNWRDKAKGIRCNECRSCHSNYNKADYQKNRSKVIARSTKRKNETKAENYAKVDAYLLEHPCVDCGETDLIVLEFDHKPGTKKKSEISKLICAGYNWDVILKEINKCDVRCANDHRRRTAERGNWYARGDSNS